MSNIKYGKDKVWGPINLEIHDTLSVTLDQYETSGFGMILWKHCELVVETMKCWLPEFIEAAKSFEQAVIVTEKEETLWNVFSDVYKAIQMTEEQVEEAKKTNFNRERKLFANFGFKYVDFYGNTESWYLHLVCCHTIEVSLFQEYKFTNERIMLVMD